MPDGYLNEGNGAWLQCAECGQQVQSNEYHKCTGTYSELKADLRVFNGKTIPRWKALSAPEVSKHLKNDLITMFLEVQGHVGILQAALDAQSMHPFRIEQLLADWRLAAEKMYGVGIVFEPSTDPCVRLIKQDVEVRIHYRHVMQHGMLTLLSMFRYLPDSSVPPKHKIEGFDPESLPLNAQPEENE